MTLPINQIICGDCLEVLKTFPDDSIDCVVTDPPYELGFMGKSWDNTGIANNKEMWSECLRVLKPGGHLLSFGGTRTYHRMACAIEDAGFEVRDMIEWVYGSGFPKSLNIGKAVDKIIERKDLFEPFSKHFSEQIEKSGKLQKEIASLFPSKTGGITGCVWNWANGANVPTVAQWNILKPLLGLSDEFLPLIERIEREREVVGLQKKAMSGWNMDGTTQFKDRDITKGTSEWEGWGTALKPAHEPICMARKPLAEKTVAENCLKYGTGGINIDESRVESSEPLARPFNEANNQTFGKYERFGNPIEPSGRFPANLIHDNSEEVRECFPETKTGAVTQKAESVNSEYAFSHNMITHTKERLADSGNASRFFKSIIYQAKSSKAERNKGLDKLVLVDIMEVLNNNTTLCEKSLIKEVKLAQLLVGMEQSGFTVTAVSGTQNKSVTEWSIRLFGKDLMEKYQKDFKSIILTETHSITPSQIYKWLIRLFTKEYTADANLEMENGGNLVENAENLNELIITINEKMALALGVKSAVSPTQLRIRLSEGKSGHPTVKPIALMEYLIKMITPKGGIVLDPFAGSGSTLVAAKNLGFNYIGIERESEYVKIAEARLSSIKQQILI